MINDYNGKKIKAHKTYKIAEPDNKDAVIKFKALTDDPHPNTRAFEAENGQLHFAREFIDGFRNGKAYYNLEQVV